MAKNNFIAEVTFKADHHSANVSRATDAVRWQMGFFSQSPFEANEMFCLLNKFVHFTN